MRYLILLLTLLFASPAWGATIVLDQQTAKAVFDNDDGTSPFSFGTLPAVGSLVVVTCFGQSNTGSFYNVTSVTDNQGNTYTLAKTSVIGTQRSFIARAPNVASSGTFTVTVNNVNSTDNYLVCRASSFTGIVTSSPLDQSGEATDPGPQAADAGVSTAGSTAQADELVVACASIGGTGDANLNIGTATTGYINIVNEQDYTLHSTGSCDYKIVSSVGVQTANWSHDDITGSGAQDGWTAIIATFKAAVSTRRQMTPVMF